MGFPLVFSVLNSPSSLSLSSQERCSSTLIIFVIFCWTCSSTSIPLLSWGIQNWTQHSRIGFNSAKWRGRTTHLSLLAILALKQPKVFPCLEGTLWLTFSLVYPRTPSPFLLKSFPSGCSPTHTGLFLHGCRTLYLSFFTARDALCTLLFGTDPPASCIPSGWQHKPLACLALLPLLCHLQIC